MKSLLFLGALSLFAFAADVANSDVPPALGASQPGRFKLESGTYRGMDGSNATPVALRIDTATGKTWRLTDRQTDNGFVATWVPIPENVPSIVPKTEKAH